MLREQILIIFADLHAQALSEFADYVQREQARRHNPTSTSATTTADHAELDILDSLDLGDDIPKVRLKHLLLDDSTPESTAQLNKLIDDRLDEGHGETLFDIGLEDNGDSMGFERKDWDTAYARILACAKEQKADVRLLLTRNVGTFSEGDNVVEVNTSESKDKTCSGKVMIRRIPQSVDDVIETRIAVVGNVDAGKSTMLGVLVKGGLDDGRGKARVNLFRHKHEIESGRTSSVGMEIMGFDSKGEVVAATVPGRKLSWQEIGQRSV
jgi:GTPase